MLKKKSSHVIVKTHHPLRLRIFLAVLIVALLISGWMLFDYGRSRAGFDSMVTEKERKMLRAKIMGLEENVAKLRGQNAILAQANEIDRQAYDQVGASLKDLQDEILELKQEVDFYRGIVSSSGAEGLNIQAVTMRRNGETSTYRYKLVLSQFVKTHRLISGGVKMTFFGINGDDQQQLQMEDVRPNAGDKVRFRFKYFQELEGDIWFPEGFSPLRVEIVADPDGNAMNPVRKMYSWPDILA